MVNGQWSMCISRSKIFQQSISGSAKILFCTLSSGSEGAKNNFCTPSGKFSDCCVFVFMDSYSLFLTSHLKPIPPNHHNSHYHLPFITYHSSLTIHHLPFITYHSSFTIHHSPFTIHHLPFITYHSSFTIHHSPFTIHHSPFTIHH